MVRDRCPRRKRPATAAVIEAELWDIAGGLAGLERYVAERKRKAALCVNSGKSIWKRAATRKLGPKQPRSSLGRFVSRRTPNL